MSDVDDLLDSIDDDTQNNDDDNGSKSSNLGWFVAIGIVLLLFIGGLIYYIVDLQRRNQVKSPSTGSYQAAEPFPVQPTPGNPVLTDPPKYIGTLAPPHPVVIEDENISAQARVAAEYDNPVEYAKTHGEAFVFEDESSIFRAIAEREGMLPVGYYAQETEGKSTKPRRRRRVEAAFAPSSELSPDWNNVMSVENMPPVTEWPAVQGPRSLQSGAEKQLREEMGLQYCGSRSRIYIPSGKEGVNGSCADACADNEDFVIWRKPWESSYQYYCRKQCGPSPTTGQKNARMDSVDGTCERKLQNPTFFTDDKAMKMTEFGGNRIAMYQKICGTPNKRFMGRYCYDTGGWDRNIRSPNAWKPLPTINCPTGWSKGPNYEFCYQCPSGFKLRGNDADGWLCVEDCPQNSSDLVKVSSDDSKNVSYQSTGSSYLCYLDGTVMKLEGARSIPDTGSAALFSSVPI